MQIMLDTKGGVEGGGSTSRTRYAGRRRRRQLCLPACVSAPLVLDSDNEEDGGDGGDSTATALLLGSRADPCIIAPRSRSNRPCFAWPRFRKRTKTVPMAYSGELDPIIRSVRAKMKQRRQKKDRLDENRPAAASALASASTSAPAKKGGGRGFFSKLKKRCGQGYGNGKRIAAPPANGGCCGGGGDGSSSAAGVQVETRRLQHLPQESRKHHIRCHSSILSAPRPPPPNLPITSAAAAAATAVAGGGSTSRSRTAARKAARAPAPSAAARSKAAAAQQAIRMSIPAATLAAIVFYGRAAGVAHLVLFLYLIAYLRKLKSPASGAGAARVSKPPAAMSAQQSLEKQKQKVVLDGFLERKQRRPTRSLSIA